MFCHFFMFVQTTIIFSSCAASHATLHLFCLPLYVCVCVCVLKQRAESGGGHSRLPEVTAGVKGQAVLIRCDVLPWDLRPMRDHPLIGVS